MDLKDLFAIGFSAISLIISISTLYLTQFRPAKVTVSSGPMVHLFYIQPSQPTIFLPVVFHNSSPTKAIVYSIFLEIEDTKGEHFALKWVGSVKIDLSNNYTDTSLAGPFKIDGYETIPNALRFFWVNGENMQQLDWLEGTYLLTLHIWTTANSISPDHSVKETMVINKEVAATMAQRKASSDARSWFLPLVGKGLLSFSTGKKPIQFRHIMRS
ncbi:hypothetical protein [Rhodopseudomonas sp. B29]|uniref:hypothetical protein n=1 Tax=Rhodopseudomonas sp. B29 TaxID=95607 RepID=UPI0011D295D5|nr:hypothetical protein [Rhodopseudomonas sp. B29]